jgi:hypothetical protein
MIVNVKINFLFCALQDKVWVHDPDGAPWEIYTVLSHSQVRDIKPVEVSNKSCACS